MAYVQLSLTYVGRLVTLKKKWLLGFFYALCWGSFEACVGYGSDLVFLE